MACQAKGSTKYARLGSDAVLMVWIGRDADLMLRHKYGEKDGLNFQ